MKFLTLALATTLGIFASASNLQSEKIEEIENMVEEIKEALEERFPEGTIFYILEM